MPFALFIIVMFFGFGCAQGGALPIEGHPSQDPIDASHDSEDASVDFDATSRDATWVDAASGDDGSSPLDVGILDAFVPTSDAGMCVESEMRACETTCSSQGTATCSGGVFGVCAPPVESCNRVDDDCDTQIDEGFQVQIFDPVPISELRSAHSRCDGPSAPLVYCMSAAKRWCAGHASACFNGGAGLLQGGGTAARIACFGNRAVEHMTTFAALSAAAGVEIDDENVDTRTAQLAANRYCRSLSYEAGIGPVEYSEPHVWVTCLPSELATLATVSASELLARGCNLNTAPGAFVCHSAADLECRELGHRGGYGPVERGVDVATVICFR